MEAWVVDVLKLNPIYYIISGYREAFVNQGVFWQHPKQTIYFWIFTVISCVIGCKLFTSLRPFFADEL